MKFITIEPGGGRFGNQVIMYMAALAIAEKIGGAVICGIGFPAWNIARVAPPEDVAKTIIIRDPAAFDLDALAEAVRDEPSFNIILNYHAQDIGIFLDLSFYRNIFPLVHQDVPVFGAEHLLIHIRAGDILDGAWAWYQLTPVEFIRDVVTETGKIPVFMGELDDGPYVRKLRAAFPEAAFLPQASLMQDFDMIRQARHVLVSVSTFSWLAAWLGDTETIHVPLTGFFNPAHMRHINLLPVDDTRYWFYLFPFTEAVAEVEALKVHEKLRGYWRQIPAEALRGLLADRPRAAAAEVIDIDRYWYASAYPDAGLAISEGKYENAAAHYAHVGREKGYLPHAPLMIAEVPLAANVALGKPATQSSTWEGAAVRSPECDAAGAVDGDVTKAQGFHTAIQDNPWWMLDLLALHTIIEIHIYNRADHYYIRARAAPLVLRVSIDGQTWTDLLRTAPGELFGAERGPLCWRASKPVQARYVQIMLLKRSECLHLAQVAVFGEAIEPPQAGIARVSIGADRQLWRSGMKLPARAVVLAHQRRRRRAVCVRIGAHSEFLKWFRPGATRSWDLLLSFYQLPDQPFTNDVETMIAGGLSKYAAIKDVMAQRPKIFDVYEQILLLDDDIAMVYDDVDRLFDIAAAYDLDLAQASLSEDSHVFWPFLKHSGGTLLRYTNLIEVMMPLFSRAAFLLCVATFDQSISSWGLDFVWEALIAAHGGKLAVIDAVVAAHLRPVDLSGGAFYNFLRSINIDPENEMNRLRERYHLTREADGYGVIAAVNLPVQAGQPVGF